MTSFKQKRLRTKTLDKLTRSIKALNKRPSNAFTYVHTYNHLSTHIRRSIRGLENIIHGCHDDKILLASRGRGHCAFRRWQPGRRWRNRRYDEEDEASPLREGASPSQLESIRAWKLTHLHTTPSNHYKNARRRRRRRNRGKCGPSGR